MKRLVRIGAFAVVCMTVLFGTPSTAGAHHDDDEVQPPTAFEEWASKVGGGHRYLNDADCAAMTRADQNRFNTWVDSEITRLGGEDEAKQAVNAWLDDWTDWQSGQGCSWVEGPTVSESLVEEVVTAPADYIADKVSDGFEAMVKSMAMAADDLIIETTTAWLAVPSTSAANTDASNALQQDLKPLAAVLAALGVMVGVGQMLVTMKGSALRTQVAGIVRLMIVSAAGTTMVVTLLEAGDVLADHLVSSSTGGGVAGIEGLASFEAALATGGASIGGILLLAILAIVTSIIQLGLLLVRSAIVVVLAGFLPVAAAASLVGHNKMLAKTSAWLLGFICFKPAAAAVYAGAFRLMGGDGTDADVLSVIQGLMLLVLAVAALPTVIRLFAPIADMGGPSAAGVLAGGAAVIGGGMMLAGAGGFGGGASGAQGVGGMGTQLNATETSTGPTQPPGAPPSGGSTPPGSDGPSGAPGGAPGAPGMPGVAAGPDGSPGGAEPAGGADRVSRATGAGLLAGGVRQMTQGALDEPDEGNLS